MADNSPEKLNWEFVLHMLGDGYISDNIGNNSLDTLKSFRDITENIDDENLMIYINDLIIRSVKLEEEFKNFNIPMYLGDFQSRVNEKIDEYEQQIKYGVILLSGYNRQSGHAVNMYIKYNTINNNYTVVITNSGEGVNIYHKNDDSKRYQYIVVKKNVRYAQIKQLFFHKLFFDADRYVNKTGFFALDIDNFYNILIDIFTESEDNNFYYTRLINFNKDPTVAKLSAYRRLELPSYNQKKITNDGNDYYFPPHISNSSTFFSLYYIFYYIFGVNNNIYNFYEWISKASSHSIEKINGFIDGYIKNNHNLAMDNTIAIYDVLINYKHKYINIYEDNEDIKDSNIINKYKEKYDKINLYANYDVNAIIKRYKYLNILSGNSTYDSELVLYSDNYDKLLNKIKDLYEEDISRLNVDDINNIISGYTDILHDIFSYRYEGKSLLVNILISSIWNFLNLLNLKNSSIFQKDIDTDTLNTFFCNYWYMYYKTYILVKSGYSDNHFYKNKEFYNNFALLGLTVAIKIFLIIGDTSDSLSIEDEYFENYYSTYIKKFTECCYLYDENYKDFIDNIKKVKYLLVIIKTNSHPIVNDNWINIFKNNAKEKFIDKIDNTYQKFTYNIKKLIYAKDSGNINESDKNYSGIFSPEKDKHWIYYFFLIFHFLYVNPRTTAIFNYSQHQIVDMKIPTKDTDSSISKSSINGILKSPIYDMDNSFFLIWDIFKNKKIDIANSSEYKWDTFIVHSVTINMLSNKASDITYNDIVTKGETINNLIPSNSDPITIRKNMLSKFSIKANYTVTQLRKYNIDFLIWVISMKIIFKEITVDDKQMFIDLLKLSLEGEYKYICKLLIMILKKEKGNSFINIYSKLIDQQKKYEKDTSEKKENMLYYYLINLYLRDVSIQNITQKPSKNINEIRLAKENLDNIIFLDNDKKNQYYIEKIKYNSTEYHVLDRTILSNKSLFFLEDHYSIYSAVDDLNTIILQKKNKDGTIKKYYLKKDLSGSDVDPLASTERYQLYDRDDEDRCICYYSDIKKSINTTTIFNKKYIFCWKKDDKINYIEFYEHNIKLIWKDTHYYFNNKLVVSNSDDIEIYYKKWIYNLNNAFLLKDDDKYSILILKPANDYIKELANNSFWVKSNGKYDVKLIFEKKYYELQIDDYGFSISGSDDAIQAYLSTLCLFGNYEVLEDIIIKGRILGCKLPYFHDDGTKKEDIINNPFRYYYLKLFYGDDNNDINENYNKRINWYTDRYRYEKSINWGDKSKQDINLTQKNFLDDILEVDESNDITTCKLIKDYNNEIAGKKKGIELEINLSKKTYSTNYENYNKNRTEKQVNYMFEEDIYETIYNIIYNKIQLQCLNFISDNKDNLDCQQLLEYYNRLDKNKIYTELRYNYEIYFELLFGNIIRQDQKDLIDNIIEDIKGEKDEGKNIFQMLMGKGKTSVISPLLCYYYAHIDKKEQIIMAMPGTLVPQSKNIFANYPLLLKNILLRECKEVRSKIGIEDCIQTSPNTNQVLIMEGKVLQSFLLNYVSSEDKTPEFENTVIIVDEIDTLMDPLSSELNYPDPDKDDTDEDNKPFMLEEISDIIISIIFDEMKGEYIYAEIEESEDSVDKLFNGITPTLYKDEWNYAFKKSDIFDSTHPEKISLFSKKVYLFRKIKKLFIQILTMYHNKDYGIGDFKDKFGNKYPQKNSYIAIPYISTNNPANGSSFSDPYLTLIMTILSYKYRGLNKDNIVELLHDFYLTHLSGEDLFENINNIIKDAKKTKYIINNPPKIKEYITDHIIRENKDNYEIIILFLQQFVINRFINISKNQLNSSFTDVINSNFCKYRTGFSGTTNVIIPKFINPDNSNTGDINYDNCENIDINYEDGVYKKKNEYIDIDIDSEAEAQIEFAFKYKIIKDETKDDGVFIDQDDTVNVLDNILEKIPYYDALIDVGALLRNYNSKAIAEKLYPIIRKPIVYLNKNSEKYEYDGSDFKKYKDDGNKDIFIFYDQKHTVGIDVKQQPKMAGLVTISNFNKLTDTSQGVYRLRKINRGHYVDFFIGRSIKNITTREELYIHLVEQEKRYKENSKFRALLQNVKTNTRYQNKDIGSFTEDVYNSINYINNKNDLNKKESEIFFNFIKRSVCNNSNTLQITLCKDMCNRLKNTEIRMLGKVQEKEKGKEKSKEKGKEKSKEKATNKVIEKVKEIRDDDLKYELKDMKYRDYFNGYKSKIVNGPKFSNNNIYISPYCYKKIFDGADKYAINQFKFFDCVAINIRNNDILILTYTELYILRDNIGDNKIFSKFDDPKDEKDVFIKYIMYGIIDYSELERSFNYDIKDISKFIKPLTNLYRTRLPFSDVFENNENIRKYVMDNNNYKLKKLLGLNNFLKIFADKKLNSFKKIWFEKFNKIKKVTIDTYSKTYDKYTEKIQILEYISARIPEPVNTNTNSVTVYHSLFLYENIEDNDYIIKTEITEGMIIDMPVTGGIRYKYNNNKPYLIKNVLIVYDSKKSIELKGYKYINIIITDPYKGDLIKALFLIQEDENVNVHIPNLFVDQATLEDVQKVIDPNIRLILWDKEKS